MNHATYQMSVDVHSVAGGEKTVGTYPAPQTGNAQGMMKMRIKHRHKELEEV